MTQSLIRSAIEARRGRSWCLFLDRDGVLNTRVMDGYVTSWAGFDFEPGVLAALPVLAAWAPRIVVVTNQQGVGKGLMSTADLDDIHARMLAAATTAGGRIDEVRVCPHLASEDCDCRKPRPGMAVAELESHPGLDPALSIMVGDTEGDIEMGRRLGARTGGCLTVRIGAPDPGADLSYPDLAAFAAGVATVRAAAAAGQSAE